MAKSFGPAPAVKPLNFERKDASILECNLSVDLFWNIFKNVSWLLLDKFWLFGNWSSRPAVKI